QFYFLSENKPQDSYERELFREFKSGTKTEASRMRPNEQALNYYAPIRVANHCLTCHNPMREKEGLTQLAADDIISMVRIRMPTKSIEEGIHWNRAILITTAIATAILIMVGSWIIVRYIIVKPVKHLKEVSDAISAGELNVRSEIQTGDEF